MAKVAKVMSALGAVLAMGSAQALSVGGVVWDPDSLFDFTATDSMIETIANPVIGGQIQGYAKINTLNGTDQSTFCPGCELTYTFSGYTITNIDAVTGALTFSGGTINVFVDNTPDYDSLSALSAGDGVLFLSLTGNSHIDQETGRTGTLHADPTPASVGVAGDGRGFLDVTGGLAATYFDTNVFPLLAPGGGTEFADFQFTSSFQLLPGAQTFKSDDGVTYGLFGSNDLQGASVAVPVPGTMALLGLGLLGAGVMRRRFSA